MSDLVEAVVTRMHLGADQQPVTEGEKLTLSKERFAELRAKGLVKEVGDPSNVQPRQAETKLAPAPRNKKAQESENKSGAPAKTEN